MSVLHASKEQAAYFEVAGADVYTVLHAVDHPAARILLVGPFASERQQSYLHWARWARYLAARRIEVLRFDYRGVGESTGVFEQMTFVDWVEDVAQLSLWLDGRKPAVPLLLHGLGLGALIAARCFDESRGDGLLLWSPPPDANVALRSLLRRTMNLQQLARHAEEWRPLSSYLAQLEEEGSLEVSGYRWSKELWSSSLDLSLPDSLKSADRASAAYSKPVRVTTLGRESSPMVGGGLKGFEEDRDFTGLYAATFDWIRSVLPGMVRAKR